ncbi:MAG: protease modulator HflC [Lachnospiraceae bacterium]|nr:protease modulator HflC [Lachnospiraceae bacterium]
MKAKKVKIVIIVLIVLAAVILIPSCFFTVKQNEYGAVIQFGKIVRVEDTAGLKTKIPFIQSVTYITKATQIYDITPSDVITADKKSMIADTYLLWRVENPTRYMQTLNGSTSGAQDRCSVAVYNATKNIISSMTQDEVIAARGELLTDLITEGANSDIGGYGIVIEKAELKALDLPDNNKEAVYERMISERNNIAASYEAQGQAQAKKIRNETDRQVEVMKAEAERDAAVLEAEGEATYMQTLQEAYNTEEKADFYNFLRSLDAVKASMKGSNKTVILDKNSELARILYGQM